MKQTLGKQQKLKSRKQIGELVLTGEIEKSFPIKMIYIKVEDSEGEKIKVSFSVPKRNFPLACDRNRVKRQMREVYRLNKEHICVDNSYIIMFICVARVKMKYEKLEKAMKKVLSKLN